MDETGLSLIRSVFLFRLWCSLCVIVVRAQTKKNGMYLHPLLCHSFRSQGTTKRSVHRPMGETRYKSVRDGNILAGRAAVLVLLAAAKYCWTVLEQPSSSVMEHLPVMQQLWSLVPHVKHTMCMGDYGSPTLKRTHLYSRALQCQRNMFLF